MPWTKLETKDRGTGSERQVAHCRIELPQHVYAEYEKQAIASGKDPELVMRDRLIRCAGQIDNGLHFNNVEKAELERLIGKRVSDAAGALQFLTPLAKIDVGGVVVELEPTVRKRLATRTLRGQTLEELIEQQVKRSLRQYVGLEPY